MSHLPRSSGVMSSFSRRPDYERAIDRIEVALDHQRRRWSTARSAADWPTMVLPRKPTQRAARRRPTGLNTASNVPSCRVGRYGKRAPILISQRRCSTISSSLQSTHIRGV
jgi:hypothetical protein